MLTRRLASYGRTALVTVCCGCVLLALLFTACQRSMLYHPTRYPVGALDNAAAKYSLRPWHNPAGQRIGWERSTPGATSQVLIVHGNAGSALDRVDFARALQGAGPVNVYILEYPGYGDRAGSPSQESLLDAATEAFRLLTNGPPVYVIGESLGTGVAAWLAGTYPDAVRGLLLFCPYNNLTDVAKYHVTSLVPVGLLLRDRFPSEDWLRAYRGPVGILVAKEDTIVPARFGRQLYDGYAGPKKLWEIANAGHNDVCVRPDAWWQEVFAFWNWGS